MKNNLDNVELVLPIKESTSTQGLFKKFKQNLREAVMGTEQDFTQGSIDRAIMLLSIPMVLEMSMESLFAIVDVFFVARLGADAIATVGLTESILTLIFAVAMGLSMATTALVARRIGEKSPEDAAKVAVQAIIVGTVISLAIGVVAIFLTPTLFQLMGASQGVISTGTTYARVMLGGNITIMMLFLINAIFRGAGDAAIAMRVLIISNLCNIILDPCLIFGLGPFPELGVTGAAIATTSGRAIGVIYQLWALFSNNRIKIKPEHLGINLSVMKQLLKISLGGIFQYLVATASWLGLVRMVAIFGENALAGYTIALRVIVFAILPSWGMSNAAATLVGQNLGAELPERAEKSVWRTGLINMIFLAFVTVVFVLFAEPIVRLFTSDTQVVFYGVSCLIYVSYGYIFYAYGMVMVQAFNGAGDTTTPTIINLCCYWLFQIPLAYVLATKTTMGAQGVFIAITIAESVLAVVGVLVFRRGYWKNRKI
ncbi:MAG: MATE family efflux transporter [Acidobacteria bacterium]|nr:MATE family efflux transporter [Acidobacteriota bacterium]